jgi:DNA-binding transcriptional LysR family regulator
VELRQLRYFVTVAEHRNFGRAAEALHIVQPAVSQQVARLERELGLTLFDRSRRQIALTPDGQEFLPHARRVLDAADHAARAAAELAGGHSGLLRVGSSEVLGPRLEQILAAFRRRRPDAVIELVTGRTPDKLAAVAAGDLDAAFVRAAEPTPGVRVHQLWDEPLHAAIPARYLPADEGLVVLKALAGLPLSRAGRASNPGVHDLITAACRAAGFTPRPGPSFGSIQDLLAAHVAAGRCWTLLYAGTPAAAIPAGVAFLPISPALRVPTGLAVPDPAQRLLAGELLASAHAAITVPAPGQSAGQGGPSESPPGPFPGYAVR